MAFWNLATIEPLRKRNFLLQIGEEQPFTIKNVSKPKFDVDQNEYQLINLSLKYPTVVKWQDVTFKMVDTVGQKEATKFYNKVFGEGSYLDFDADHLPYNKFRNKDFVILQFDANKTEVEKWTLVNPFIKSVDFGDNDYSTDDLIEISVTVAYDYAVLGDRAAQKTQTIKKEGGPDLTPPSSDCDDVNEEEMAEAYAKLLTNGVIIDFPANLDPCLKEYIKEQLEGWQKEAEWYPKY